MDETPRQRLARLIAGAQAESSPMPNFAVGANPNMLGFNPNMSPMPNAAPNPYAFLPPYTGLRNDMSLSIPQRLNSGGGSAMTEPPFPPPPVMPRQQAAPAPMPQQQAGGQGWGGPEPAPGTMPELQQQPVELDPRYLPEQWRGRFNTGWG